jgi:uncharacterized protein
VSDGSVRWRRVDLPGHESARLERTEAGWELMGRAAFIHEGCDCRLDYRITCDESWRTRGARVTGRVGFMPVDIGVEVDAADQWRLNGEACPQVDGCVDLDLNFSPSTNLLPIRRLRLEVGEQAEVRAAWLRFPGFTLEPLAQSYRRTAMHGWRYESAGGAFVRDLLVNDDGFVLSYPGVWEANG